MIGQTWVPEEKTPVPLQVETDQTASFEDVASRRSARFLWTALGSVVLVLIGVSACALHPLASHVSPPASAKKNTWSGALIHPIAIGPRHSFALTPKGHRRHPDSGRARTATFSPAALLGHRLALFQPRKIATQSFRRATVSMSAADEDTGISPPPVRWFSLFEKSKTEPKTPSTRSLAVYPLPAVYLPGSTCTLRNIEPRNIAMAREQSVIVASLLDNDRFHCATVGAVLRIDDVSVAKADSSGQVLASNQNSSNLIVQATVLGRVELLRCDNLEVWSTRETYLMAEVAEYDDDEAEVPMTEELQEDVQAAIYLLVVALLESSPAEAGISIAPGVAQDATGRSVATAQNAAVAALQDAASHVASGRWWEALEIWQRHCATRAFTLQAQHQSDRNEFVIDAKLRQGGVLQLPVKEHTLPEEDQLMLRQIDIRAKSALDQLGLDDAETFQACLEARSTVTRAKLLREGVLREAKRLARRSALQRAYDAS